MVDFAVAGWATTAFVALAVYAYWLAWRVCKDRLMRCPETDAITLVGVAPDSRRAGTSGVEVQRCRLWPDRANCARGCLARYGETAPGCWVNLEALRPFKRS